MRGDIFKKTCEYILVLMMVCILLLTGCSESNDTDEDDMIKAEESSGISAVSLVIGSDNYEPYNYIDESGENVGIDVDIAKEACRRLGITPVFKQITWDRKDSFLDSNEIDCLWGSFTMSGRTDDYRWAGPYMYSRQVVVARKDRGINSFADLKGTLEVFAKELFGEDTKTKFRPHHFPFTEPSAEMDVSCFKCGGKGCRFCKGSGWIEILGCGMVHPHVLEMCGIDPEEYTGFAFGVGLERIALLKYEIDDMRLLYENDIRFLKQF